MLKILLGQMKWALSVSNSKKKSMRHSSAAKSEMKNKIKLYVVSKKKQNCEKTEAIASLLRRKDHLSIASVPLKLILRLEAFTHSGRYTS